MAALEQWPRDGIPENPGAWLMGTARKRGIDRIRRAEVARRKSEELGRTIELRGGELEADLAAVLDDPFVELDDDLLRLVFTTCHPVLPTEARVALTLRLVGGLTVPEIASAYLVSEATISQRIVRAKRTLAERGIAFEVPRRQALPRRLRSVLEVLYLVFNEGYAASQGECESSCSRRPCSSGRILAELMPEEPEVHGLVALMELQASRTRARLDGSRRSRAAPRAGPQPLELAPRGPRPGVTRSRLFDGRLLRPLRAAGGDRGLPLEGAAAGGHGLGADRRPLRRARGDLPLAGRRTQPRRRRRDGGRSRADPGDDRRGRARSLARRLRAASRHRTPSSASTAEPRRGRSSSAAALSGNERQRDLLLRRAARC